MRDGWVTVGDVATRDGDGFVTILDRSKDMVVSGGISIYPREVELVLASVPGVREAAVVGPPDPEWGEALHAFVVGDEPRDALADALTAAACGRRAPRKHPKGISFIDILQLRALAREAGCYHAPR